MSLKPLNLPFPFKDREIKMPRIEIRFDLITALKQGITDHPQKVVSDLGMIVFALEGVPIADCVIMEVGNVPDQLPSYIEILTE